MQQSASLSPELKSGVYRLAAGGAGQATLFATHQNMTFPNDLLFDKQGRLFVSDSYHLVLCLRCSQTVT